GHLVTDPAVAATFLAYWQQLHADTPDLRPFCESETPLTGNVVFSPRSSLAALDHYAQLIAGAQQAVFITAPFGLAPPLRGALAVQRDIPRYELLESRDAKLINALKVDPDNQIAAGAYLGQEGGWKQFLQEHLTGLNDHVKYIHTKYLLVDPLTDDPIVVSGS